MQTIENYEPSNVKIPTTIDTHNPSRFWDLFPSFAGFKRCVESKILSTVNLSHLRSYKNQSKLSIERMTGSQHFCELIECLTTQLVNKVPRSDNQQEIIKGIFDYIIFKGVENLAGKVELEFFGNSSLGILSLLIKLGSKHLPEICEKLERLDEGVNRRLQLQEIFASFGREFLSLVFDEGEEDLNQLPKPIRAVIWNSIRQIFYQEPDSCVDSLISLMTGKLIPENFVFGLILQFANPLKDNGRNEILQFEGGQLVIDAIEKGVAYSPWIINKMSHAISEKCIEKINPPVELKDWLNSWIISKLMEVSNSPSESIKLLFQFPEMYLKATLNQVILSLAKGDSNNLVGNIADKFVIPLTRFFENQKVDLKSIYEIVDEKKKNAELKIAFKPLADEILHRSGLDNKDVLRIPFGQGLFSNLLKEEFPLLCAHIYSELMIEKNWVSSASSLLELNVDVSKDKFEKTSAVLAQNILPATRAKIHNTGLSLALSINTLLQNYHLGSLDSSQVQKGIEFLTKAQTPSLSFIWNKLETAVAHLITFALRNLSNKDTSSLQNDLAKSICVLLRVTSDHLIQNQEAFSKSIDKIKQLPPGQEQNVLIFNTFSHLSKKILMESDLNDLEWLPNIPVLKPIIFDGIKNKFLPYFLYDLYNDMTVPRNRKGEISTKLRELLFDEKYAFENYPQDEMRVSLSLLYNERENLKNEIWNKTGISDIAKQIESSFSILAHHVNTVVGSYIGNNSQFIAQLICGVLPSAKMNSSEVVWVGEGLKEVSENFDPAYGHDLLYATFLKFFVSLAEKCDKMVIPKPGEHSQLSMVANILIKIVSVIHSHSEIRCKVTEIDQNPDPDKHLAKLRKAFRPLSDDLVKLLTENPLEHIPMTRFFKQDLLKVIQEELLPDLLILIYRDMTYWQTKSIKYKNELFEIFGTTHPTEACRVIAQFGGEFIPYYLATSNKDTAILIENVAKEYVLDVSPQIESFIAHNVKEIGENQLPEVISLKPVSASLIESILLKLFSNFSNHILSIEQGNPDFILDTFTKFLTVTSNHFTTMNQVTQKSNKANAWRVSYNDMFAGFGHQLHKAIPSPSLTQEQKTELRLDRFYRPMTNKLIEIANLENDAEFNKYFEDSTAKTKFWDLCRKEILPRIWHNIYEKILDPHTIRTMLLNSLETLDSTFNKIPSEVPVEEICIPDDEEQLMLNEACGKLILELLNLIPRTLAHTIFEIDKVKKMTATTIGLSVRKSLQQWSWIQLIDKSIVNGLPNFRTGVWEGPSTKEVFVPKKILLKPDGTEVLEPDTLTFNLPKTFDGKQVFKAQQEKIEKATEVKLKKKMARMLSRQIQYSIDHFITSHWESVQNFADRNINKYFGLAGLKTKAFLDMICRKIFIEIIGRILAIAFCPVKKISLLLLEKYLALKVEDLSKDAIQRIQENLLFKLTEEFLDSLQKDPNELKKV